MPGRGVVYSTSNQRAPVVTHICKEHFKLPMTIKEQKALNIEDDRDPNEYVRVDEALAQRRL